MASPVASTSATKLPSWPPSLTSSQLSSLTAQATDYALSHGLVYRPIGNPPPSTHVHHAPISLLPSPFPRSAFQQALQIQGVLNELYARVAVDDVFLERVIGKMVAPVDDFTRGLWEVYSKAKQQGVAPTYHLGLFRSDYLLHDSPSAPPTIRQVEFNTISSSFGPLCQKVSELHRSLLMQTDYYSSALDQLQLDNLPKNTALTLLSDGLAQAHKAYLAESGWSGKKEDTPRVLFVVQEKERNAFDQRWLEFELLEKHGIRSTRRTFSSLITSASRDSSSGALLLSSETSTTPVEVSVVYYRSGYTPTDYTTPDHWDLRFRLESTTAIKCPTVALQLAGAKKVQQVLAEEGVLEHFLSQRYPAEALHSLRQTWAELYPLDSSPLGEQGQKLAREEPERFVMKPQREGGGNNIYREEIPRALAAMEERDAKRPQGTPKEREGYILMELILPPQGLGNYLIRPPAVGAGAAAAADSSSTGQAQEQPTRHAEGLQAAECRLSPDVVSELGIYGVALFRSSNSNSASSNSASGTAGALDEKTYWSLPTSEVAATSSSSSSSTTTTATRGVEAAYLLRTKGRESDEGGVAVGFSVLDSLVLV
ncbi:glutathione synthase [Microstroma glucosiphilum]|uniref:Glutathione synthetase n=1 Tax=Pseudomicrostroma glucosiphilum TaxID=1684307 RepID=A0A316U0L3_9BASI|nr:glutathione synthase [Pseudomicrostroma glucosiphilum]PWN18071.1 glutathione synthase [Pseudomicrostroma glucosiphilum]